MNFKKMTRRGLLSGALGVGAAGSVPAQESPAIFPDQAWIIIEQKWHHNDEFYVADGGCAQHTLFYSLPEAEAECRRLCEEFFSLFPPEDYRDEMECYLDPGSYDPSEVTWDQLCAAGYRGPYQVHALQSPTRKPPP